MPYSSLNADRITNTLSRLQARVSERFPDRGLRNVCDELLQISERQLSVLEGVRKPRTGLRVLIALVLVMGLAAIGLGLAQKLRLLASDAEELYSFEGIEALVNMALLLGAGLWFLLNLETRIKREKALESLHELRSMAHVIDMHQLTKDPTATLIIGPTKSSPTRDLSPHELMRYLDYCTEMLSLTGKLAALYMQGLRDPVVIQAVNEIEELTTNLSNKIWQKLQILHASIDIVGTGPRAARIISPPAGHPSNQHDQTKTENTKETQAS